MHTGSALCLQYVIKTCPEWLQSQTIILAVAAGSGTVVVRLVMT